MGASLLPLPAHALCHLRQAFVPSGADGRVDFRAIDGAHRVVPFEAAALAGGDFGEWRDEARGAGAGAKRKRRGSTGVDLHLKVR